MKSEKSPEKSRIETLGKQAAELKEKAGKQAEKAGKTGKAPKKEEEVKKSSKKEDDGSVKPTKGASAYLFYNTETVERLKKEEGLSHKEAFTKSGQLWQGLSEDDKAPWAKLAAADAERHAAQCKELEENGFFIMKDGTKSSDHKKKAKYDENVRLPKRTTSAYIFFTTENVNKVKAERKLEKHTEAMAACGEIWRGLSDEQKE